jgi:hypothetical protein
MYILVCFQIAPPLRAADQMTKRQRTRGSRATRDQQIKGGARTSNGRKGRGPGIDQRRMVNKGTEANVRFAKLDISPLTWPHYSKHIICWKRFFQFCLKIRFKWYTNLVGFHYFSFQSCRGYPGHPKQTKIYIGMLADCTTLARGGSNTKRQRTKGNRATKGPADQGARTSNGRKGEGQTKGRKPRFYSWNKISAPNLTTQ